MSFHIEGDPDNLPDAGVVTMDKIQVTAEKGDMPFVVFPGDGRMLWCVMELTDDSTLLSDDDEVREYRIVEVFKTIGDYVG